MGRVGDHRHHFSCLELASHNLKCSFETLNPLVEVDLVSLGMLDWEKDDFLHNFLERVRLFFCFFEELLGHFCLIVFHIVPDLVRDESSTDEGGEAGVGTRARDACLMHDRPSLAPANGEERFVDDDVIMIESKSFEDSEFHKIYFCMSIKYLFRHIFLRVRVFS